MRQKKMICELLFLQFQTVQRQRCVYRVNLITCWLTWLLIDTDYNPVVIFSYL